MQQTYGALEQPGKHGAPAFLMKSSFPLPTAFCKTVQAFYKLSGSCLPQGNACERSGQAGTQTAEVARYLATSPYLPASSESAGNN